MAMSVGDAVKLLKIQLKVQNRCLPSYFPKPSLDRIGAFGGPVLAPDPYV